MKKLFVELIRNESGLILCAEMVLILTIAVLGVIVGLVNVQTAIVSEFQDIALAFGGLNQSFMTPTFMGCRKWFGPTSWTAGSGFIDFYDACVGSGPWGGGMGGGFGGGMGGYGGGMGGGYAEIGGNGYYSSQVIPPAPCETCPPGTTTTTTVPDPATTTPASPTPLPPPAVPTRDSL